MALAYPSMPFLRPLGLPRRSILNHFKQLSCTAKAQREIPERIIAHASVDEDNNSALKSVMDASPPEVPPPTASPEPYIVHRTPSRQLPIYLDAKRGGNLHQTRIRKIEGNITELRNQLQQALQIPPKDIAVNQLTRHILIKVWKVTP
ncbi:MAG: hypothetical protein M1835_007456 [Candelina submexicana]|nr:MAG: hypothetical protein M1835_007456 [Candelina submexicana]